MLVYLGFVNAKEEIGFQSGDQKGFGEVEILSFQN